MLSKVGVVAIGRNEGERLTRCLEGFVGVAGQVVYVDSGSTDGSVEMARAMGAAVVELDTGVPFSAARARNEGFRRWQELAGEPSYVQFVDGDCQIAPGWMEKAVAFLDEHPDVAVVYGRLRERHPERSVYNRLRELGYEIPFGEVHGCGGIALMRADAFEAAGGFRTELICGEEPELCIRLRGAGWRIWHLDEPMASHDAAMTRFGQWWTWSLRGGYGVGQAVDLHGAAPGYHSVRLWISGWFWGLAVPLGAVGLAAWWGPWSLLLLLLYPLQVARLAARGGPAGKVDWSCAALLVLGKIPQMLGQIRFLALRCLRRPARLIEYK